MDYPLEDSNLWRELNRRVGQKADRPQKLRAAKYLGRLDDLRQVCEDVLPLVSAMFPHYLPHGVKHSRAIIFRLGQLIPKQTIRSLTCAELYVLMASAFCHDLGMVVTQEDVETAEGSPEFGQFREDRADKWAKIEKLRAEGEQFAADLAYRYFLAEWFRHRHAQRSGQFILAHALELADLGCGDHRLLDAIVATASGHWLDDPRDLEDETRFRTDLQTQEGEDVNVRFLALCLRIGDLLDMDSPRACPLLRRLVEDLPEGSRAHWERHDALDVVVKPESTKILRTCKSQEEHRLLHEWCEWLHAEVERAAALLADQPEDRRLKITPAKVQYDIRSDGSYIFTQYRFGLDDEQVFEKLFGENLYGSKSPFIRELLQNALDATRCRVIEDLREAGTPWDESEPTWQLPKKVCERYPITFTLDLREYRGEQRLVISCHDCGIGMDQRIIENHFLKVGRTYYDSHEFKSRYQFRPIGQFGIGFMSCFMAADYVEVETCRDPFLGASPEEAGDPIRLSIPGWRNYFLTAPAEHRLPQAKRPSGFQPKSYHGHGTSVHCYLTPDVYVDLREALQQAVAFPEFLVRADCSPAASAAMAARAPKGTRAVAGGSSNMPRRWSPRPEALSVDLSGPEMAPSRLRLGLSSQGTHLSQNGIWVGPSPLLDNLLLGSTPGSAWTVTVDLWGRDSLPLTTNRQSVVSGHDASSISAKALPLLHRGIRTLVHRVARGAPPERQHTAATSVYVSFGPFDALLCAPDLAPDLLAVTHVLVWEGGGTHSLIPLAELPSGAYRSLGPRRSWLAPRGTAAGNDTRTITVGHARDAVPLWVLTRRHSIQEVELPKHGGGLEVTLGAEADGRPLAFGPRLSDHAAVGHLDGWWILNPEHRLAQALVVAIDATPAKWEAHPWVAGLRYCPGLELLRLDHNGACLVGGCRTWGELIYRRLSGPGMLDGTTAHAWVQHGVVATLDAPRHV
jgi:hypothetical protein